MHNWGPPIGSNVKIYIGYYLSPHFVLHFGDSGNQNSCGFATQGHCKWIPALKY